MNGALFRGRIFCRLYLNVSLEFPALCRAVSHAKTNNSDFRDLQILAKCIHQQEKLSPYLATINFVAIFLQHFSYMFACFVGNVTVSV